MGWPLTARRPADNLGIAGEPLLPDALPENDYRRCPTLVVVGSERPAEERTLADHGERAGER